MTSAGNDIRPIELKSAGNILAGQVITDLRTAVKELVENSLDAKATSIEVRLKDSGLTLIEVVDNGEGIAPEDYANVALQHATSKLSSFEDLTSLNSFGFRGEALFSLCASAEKVTITTSTGANGPMGTVLEFDQGGKLVSSSKKVARTRGTTVSVRNVFFVAAVRRKEAQRNLKREMDRILRLMYAYTLVPCTQRNGGVKLVLTNQASNGKKTVPLGNQSQRATSLRQAVSNLWTSKALEHLVDLDLEFEVETAKTVLKRSGMNKSSASNNNVRVRGLISKFSVGCGRGTTDRQYFFVNGRPCEPKKVTQAINSVYKTFNMTQSPFIVADFIIPPDACDINVDPDKRSILLHSEDNLVEALKRTLQEKFGDARSTFSLNDTQSGPAPSQTSLSRSSSQVKPEADKPPVRPRLRKPVDSDTLDLDEDKDVEHSSSVQHEIDPTPSRRSARSSSPELGASLASNSPIERDVLAKSKSAPHTRFPSPEPLSSSYAGHRSPAHIDRIVSAAPNRPSSSRPRDVQMVLDTSGAAWNLRRDSAEPPKKRARLVDEPTVQRSTSFSSSSSNTSRLARAGLRDKLKDFARAGSHAPLEDIEHVDDTNADDDHEPIDEEGIDVTMGERHEGGGSSPPIRALRVDPETQTDNSWTQEDQLAGTTPMEVDEEPVEIPSRPHTPRLLFHPASPPLASKSLASGRSSSPLFLSDNDEDEPSGELKRSIEEREPSPPIDYDMSSDLHVAPAVSSRQETQEDKEVDAPPALAPHNDVKVRDVHSSSVVAETEPLSTEGGDDVTRTVEDSCDVTVSLDLDRLAAVWQNRRPDTATTTPLSQDAAMQVDDLQQDAAGLANTDDKAAVEALARVLSKDDFACMEVTGQFNKGFIIGRRRTDTLDDLFIIDQHAADEKYNFERLQQTTKIESQRLIEPEALELPAADALVAVDNIDILRQNGFEVEVEEGENEDDAARKVMLLATPVSKSTAFNRRDLEELIHLMRDLPTGTMVRCSKARIMFASRACRSSVMFGHPLTNKQMTTIVRHMVGMDQPWHCPHGRPTMRHLADISSLSRRHAGVDWSTVRADGDEVE
ncbi:DNA mismatch repair protein MutL [Peniophora sp. CONT]|nr:DNA mismatch repair protein MutL [Peniophora sp. CONT]